MYSGNLSKSHIWDAGANRPRTRTILSPDGATITEKLPSIVSEKWVDPNGHVVELALNNAAGNRSTNTPTAGRVRETQQRRGALRYGECPVRTGRGLPSSMRDDKPCAIGTYSDAQACPHVERIIATRQAETAKRAREHERRLMSVEQRKLELWEKQAAQELDKSGDQKRNSTKPGSALG